MSDKFVPNVVGFKKSRRRNPKSHETKKTFVSVYDYGIQVKQPGRLFSFHIEMMRKTIANFFKRQSRVLIRCFPNYSYTSKPHDVRRGRGKGSVDGWYFFAKKNRVIVEFSAPDLELAKAVFHIVRSKMPLKVDLLVKKED